MKRVVQWAVVLLWVTACGNGRDASRAPDAPADAPADAAPACAECQLVALEPSLARAGETITLEGTFVEPLSVDFPGASPQAATVLGPHRATVTVPATAAEGRVTAKVGGSSFGFAGFRRVSFALGLGSFDSALAQADASRLTATLVTARRGAASAVVGNHVYVIGGAGESGNLDSVEHAIANADGSLGTFDTPPELRLKNARAGHTATVIGDHVVVLGGDDVPLVNSVELATIHPDGTLGTFGFAGAVIMTTQRSRHASVVIGNWLYVVGGTGIRGDLDSVERARIQSDGSLGSFATVADLALATARAGHTATVVGDHLYVVGGAHDGAPLGSVEQAAIHPDGSLGPFAVVPGVTLAESRRGHTSLVLGNALYVLGGLGANGSLDSVERATIAGDGSLGSFATVPGSLLPAAHEDHASAVVGNYLYLFGGQSSSRPGIPRFQIERASLIADGPLQPFALVRGTTWATARTGAASVAVGNQVYFVGGATLAGDYVRQVDRVIIAADGSLQRFETLPEVTLPRSRSNHTAAVIGPYVYLLGGIVGDFLVDSQTQIERATIQPDGSLSPFATVPGLELTTARLGAASAVIGNRLYVVGGYSFASSRFLTTVERATINADGSLSKFVVLPNVNLVLGRYGHTLAVLGNAVYALGGEPFDVTVERATINADGSLTTFATVPGVTLATPRQGHVSAVIGNYLYLAAGSAGGGPVFDVERAAVASDGSLSTFKPVPGVHITVDRGGASSVVVGNTLYVLGGHSGLVDFALEQATIGPAAAPSALATLRAATPASAR